jgi:hypothetical protein
MIEQNSEDNSKEQTTFKLFINSWVVILQTERNKVRISHVSQSFKPENSIYLNQYLE